MDSVAKNEELKAEQRLFLKSRLSAISHDKERELSLKFKIQIRPPQTLGELISRIEQGKYTIKNPDTLSRMTATPLQYIDWRTDEDKPDQEGFDLSKKALDFRRQRVIDSIEIKDPECALRDLIAFEDTDFSEVRTK